MSWTTYHIARLIIRWFSFLEGPTSHASRDRMLESLAAKREA